MLIQLLAEYVLIAIIKKLKFFQVQEIGKHLQLLIKQDKLLQHLI